MENNLPVCLVFLDDDGYLPSTSCEAATNGFAIGTVGFARAFGENTIIDDTEPNYKSVRTSSQEATDYLINDDGGAYDRARINSSTDGPAERQGASGRTGAIEGGNPHRKVRSL